MVKQDSKVPGVYKIGMLVPDGWTAYYSDGHLFVVTYDFKKDAVYPDFNSTVEFWTGAGFEFETLAPLVTLQPGDAVEHIETGFFSVTFPSRKTTMILTGIFCLWSGRLNSPHNCRFS